MYERIKKLCQELGLTIPELEERAGISSGAISHWRTSSPKAHNVLSVAAVLGCSVDYLLTGNTPQRSGLRIPPIPESESPKSGLRIRGIDNTAKLERLKELYVDGEITKEEYQKRKEALSPPVEIRKPTPRIKEIALSGDDLRESYQSFTRQERRAIWKSVIDRIDVDGDALAVTFRA